MFDLGIYESQNFKTSHASLGGFQVHHWLELIHYIIWKKLPKGNEMSFQSFSMMAHFSKEIMMSERYGIPQPMKLVRIWLFWRSLCSTSLEALEAFQFVMFVHQAQMNNLSNRSPNSHFGKDSSSQLITPTRKLTFSTMNFIHLRSWKFPIEHGRVSRQSWKPRGGKISESFPSWWLNQRI